MPEIQVTEIEAEKPEVQLQVIVYFHAACEPNASFMAPSNEELYARSERIRSLVEAALADEDNDVAAWAYPEVRLAQRTIQRPGMPPVITGP